MLDYSFCIEIFSVYHEPFDSYWIDYQNDWCLTKGDQVMPSTKEQHSANLPSPQKYLTLTVQDILEERVEDGTMALLGQSDISDPKLRKLILGHVVNGTGLCPAVCWCLDGELLVLC